MGPAFGPACAGSRSGSNGALRYSLLGTQLASLYFASDLGRAGPAGLNAGASHQFLAHSEKLLGGFAWPQCEAPRTLGYVPILDISW